MHVFRAFACLRLPLFLRLSITLFAVDKCALFLLISLLINYIISLIIIIIIILSHMK